ncbi:MAG: CRISPR-associated protein Cas5 [Rectinemataceae bacterium]
MNTYQVQMEISGSTAMWTRPDTGDCPVSYPAPTYSAVKGIFESILWGPAIQVIPTKVEICAPLQYHTYHTNYGGPLREVGVIASGGGYQLLATILIDVCYRIYAEVVPVDKNKKAYIGQEALSWDKKTTSPGHAYQEIFNRRLSKSQCYAIPFLGWKEFGPNYFGPFREKTKIQADFSTIVPSMLREVFPDSYRSGVAYSFDQNVAISNGTLLFAVKERNHVE